MNIAPKIKPAAKFVAQKSFSLAKRIVPGIVMMTCSFTIGHMMNGSRPRQIDPKMDANWAYHAGQQRIRDSLKIVELEQKLAADSARIFHNLGKTPIKKVIK